MPINMQGWEWVILIVLALLIFGGTRLAGAGKNAGRAIREFRDETRQIKADEEKAKASGATAAPAVGDDRVREPEVLDAEVVDRPGQNPDARA